MCEGRRERASLGKRQKDGSVEAGKSERCEDITAIEKCVCVCFIAVAPPTPPSC